MAKKTWNNFVKAHQTGICARTIIDWQDLKGQMSPKGLVFPSALGMLEEFFRQHFKNDWAVQSQRAKTHKLKSRKGVKTIKGPPVISVLFVLESQTDFVTLQKFFAVTQISGQTLSPPCASAHQFSYSSSTYGQLAKVLGYV